MSFYIAIADFFWIVSIMYLIGITLAFYVFIKKFFNEHGIIIQEIKMEKKNKKIQKLEKKKEELSNLEIIESAI